MGERKAPIAPPPVDRKPPLLAPPTRAQIQLRGVTVWLIGRWLGGPSPVHEAPGRSAWEVRGLEVTEMEAIGRVRSKDDFIAPLTIGAEFPDEPQSFPGAYYPLVEGSPDADPAPR